MLLIIIYLSFISLGLPDSLLGSAWPSIYPDIKVPVSYSGIVFFIISLGTIISSLNSDRLNKKLSTGLLTALSVSMTMIALFGFSFSRSFLELCLWAIPYGLGAGSIDAALNNYVALHYASKHMSWLHCMWGIGATLGPYIMSYALGKYESWALGYRIIGFMQLALSIVIFSSLSLWKKNQSNEEEERRPLSLKEVISISGVKEIMLTFFCYCAIEQTTGLWAATWLVEIKGIDPITAASFASFYFLGITIGRAISGFIAMKLDDRKMILLGFMFLMIGLLLLIQPISKTLNLAGLIVIGVGSAPIYPSLIHITPVLFGKQKSQSIIGVQMASAYLGNCLMAPFFGVIADYTGISLFPFYLLILGVMMVMMFKRLEANADHK